ncbi:3-hydroxyisobutyryl-CoA hydrolase, mitochondrial-like [Diabrotica virgifera virgifera]|uniref:3-hydroxyisobutyryl-CoA hydrolase, mitochondrial n=1 Tax=Diabrotica virgifera virgifera TaxID=50390 RepID=A0A6P7FBY3_DIAVI|nr:3-hydroxyisobutyryl-CoA hydrolase, mitochondrial-like [Diabrotica virgifera virgifera]XP_050511156.1 3-hydroxyisobutyryl-CoA hydrolase, mitochondrial-like [Diabrotica virgifera virgifera]
MEAIILIKETKNTAVITLNRPRQLNAVDHKMTKTLLSILKKMEKEKKLVILKGAGKAFCSGADILRASHQKTDGMGLEDFFNWTLEINEIFFVISTYQIPLITLVNGIAFGFGAGIMTFSKFSVVTERAIFSMPECKFAFHPNAGASYFFNQSQGKLGYYLGLTGERLSGTDIVKGGFARYFCHSSKLQTLEDELINCASLKDITNILDKFSEKALPPFSLDPLTTKINECFSENTIEGIFHKLQQDSSAWATTTLKTLEKYSPTSLKVSLKQLQYGKNMDLLESLAMESNITNNFYQYSDIYEGTRVLLTDRTRTPQWNPSRLSDVDEKLINAHFNSVTDKFLRQRLTKRRDELKPSLKYKL